LKLNEEVAATIDGKHIVRYKDEDKGDMEYADWIHEINQLATDAFLRAIGLLHILQLPP